MNQPLQPLDLSLACEADTVGLGRALAALLLPGMVVFLHGDLGAGKTTLARGVARGLGHGGAVKSPTYTLVEPYSGLSPPLYHFDLYRLGDPEELEFMGIRDYFTEASITLVEWPERGGRFLPAPDLEITIALEGQGRAVRISASSDRGQRCLQALASQWPPRGDAVA
jgi:tRNA threonylcarbamoyladenosine biosynthesis protein TsaE